jgi:diguanylate cyclase (GGDEF)-like protein/PAS domain S-box-containing protein
LKRKNFSLKTLFNIDPTHINSLKKVLYLVGLLFVGLLVLWLTPVFHEEHGFEHFLLFHILLETISIIVAMQVVGVGWNTFKHESFGNLVFLSILFLSVAIFDFSHLLSYNGMPQYITLNNPDKSIYFWLFARLVSSMGLLVFAIYSFSFVKSTKTHYILFTIVLALTIALHWPLLYPELITNLFFSSQDGLTNLKIYTEYFIIALNLVTALVLLKAMKEKLSYPAAYLFASVLIMAMSEFFFTMYTEISDIYNLFGHIYKVIAYFLIYRSIYIAAVRKPYKDLDIVQKKLHEKNLWLDNIIDNIPNMVFVKNISDFRFVLLNKMGENLTGLSRNQFIGSTDYDLFPKEEADFFRQKDKQTIELGSILDVSEEELETSNGKRILHTSKLVLKDQNNNPAYILGISEDITDKKYFEDKLLKLSLAVEQNPNSIIITDIDGNIEYVNEKFTTLTGYSFDEVKGQNPKILKSNKTPKETYDEMWSTLTRGDIWKGELINIKKDKSTYVEWATISPVKQANGLVTNYVAIKEDITQVKIDQDRIEHLAHFDQLTGIPNRVLLNDRVKYLLSMSQRNNQYMTVMFLDIDHFKDINDTLGHTVGDQLLVEFAKKLQNSIRAQDTVARLGGDEFIMLFPNTNSVEAAHLVTKLIKVISVPLQLEMHELSITPSIGISIYPDDGEDFETLLKHADTAMYRVKNTTRNGFRFYTEDMQEHMERNLELSNALRYALKDQQLELHYQPQISIDDGHLIGAEALLRWTHPGLGIISPAEFIPIAEESGLIIEIGEWILRTAVFQIKEWIDSGLTPIILAVNISAVQFRNKNLSKLIMNILNEAQVPPEYLEIELTEATMMADPEVGISIMNELYEKGIRMSIDDFGTGYSSLSYLKKFKAYKLKIDQSFVQDIVDDEDNRSIVSAIIDMASNLGLQTIAEGVETSDQLAFLRLHGCNAVQGYYFSKPVPSDEFVKFIKTLSSVK